ncbi:hypothetical protein GVN24_32935 [Rhizobium sp. CRIBSB]|nr:hypothetical protein [Rhizobium sp. CRIBSB]
MPVSTTTTIRDPDHLVTYTDQGGGTVTAPRDLLLTVYAPSTPGTYPVIVYSHGHGGSSGANGGAGQTAQALADLGYIVIMPNHLDSSTLYPSWLNGQFNLDNPASGLHRAADVQFALDQVQTVLNRLPGYTADVTAPVIAGHSHGAFTTGLIAGLDSDRPGYDTPPGNPYGLTSIADPRFAAAIMISPQGEGSLWADLAATAWDAITIPLLIITGTEDNEPGESGWRGRLDGFNNALDDHVYALVFRDATHADVGGNTVIPGMRASITGFIDQFLDGHLRGDAGALARFSDPAALMAGEPLLTQAFSRTTEGSAGRGLLVGDGRNDVLYGLDSDDTLSGGQGDDVLHGGGGIDRLYGGAGDDTYYTDTASDLVFEGSAGGEGLDTVITTAGFYLYANVENLTLAAGAGGIFGVGNELDNLMLGNEGANLMIAGAGNDNVRAGAGNDALFGEAGNDTLNGEGGIDYLVGGAGNDFLIGGNGPDALYGEDGDDAFLGGDDFATDIMVGGAGNDILYGDSSLGDYDLMDGGAGNDTYYVDTGDDLTFEAADGGYDTVYAYVQVENGGVYLYANVEALILAGNTAFGVGNTLDNVLQGNGLGNYLLGGAGNDLINGGGGNDVLFGEAGNDTFDFRVGTGGDVIGDFSLAGDRMNVSAFGFSSFSVLQTRFSQVGNDGAIDLGGGDFIVLHGVTMANLTASHFILASGSAPSEPMAKDGALVLPGLADDAFLPGKTGADDDSPLVLPGAVADGPGLEDNGPGEVAPTGLTHRFSLLTIDLDGHIPGLADNPLTDPLHGHADPWTV